MMIDETLDLYDAHSAFDETIINKPGPADDWLLRTADKEGNGIFSVGGLVVQMAREGNDQTKRCGVAQWQSNGLIPRRPSVRCRPRSQCDNR